MAAARRPIKKVCLIGANGTLGSVILDCLIQAAKFDVTILRRHNSSSTTKAAHAPLVREIAISPHLGLRELTAALQGQDAVIAAFPPDDVSQHLRLTEAAFRAGVERFLPTDFSSCDPASPQAQEHLQLYRDKITVRRRCEELAAAAAGSANPHFSWTAIVCGHFFEAGLRQGYLFFDLDRQTARILDSGNTRASVSTLRCVARAVVSVLERLDDTRNRVLFVHSFCPTQLELLAALERATGRTWRREQLDAKALLAKSKAAQGKATGSIEDKSTVDIVAVLRTVEADWAAKEGFATQLLGFQDEKLDDAVAEVLKSWNSGP